MNISRYRRIIGNVIKNPYILLYRFNYSRIQRILSDEMFMKIMVHAKVGYKLNLNNPHTFNEKMQWLKIHDRKPIYTQMVDKYEAKKLIAEKVGNEYVVPTYGVWKSFEDIDFSTLPDQFVLKTTHDCGGVVVCENKNTFDFESAKKNLNARLRINFYWQGREWPYKNVEPRILAEKYLKMHNDTVVLLTYDTDAKQDIIDYKIMCFNGLPYCCLVCIGRNSQEGLHENFYDREWNLMPIKRNNPQYVGVVEKPRFYKKMLEIAEIMAQGTKFLRVDFFECDDHLYVGELTFFPASGFGKFIPQDWDYKLGEMIKLGENDA